MTNSFDPHKVILDFRDSQRRNEHEKLRTIFVDFMHHFFKPNEFHYNKAPFKSWLQRHGLQGSVHTGTMKVISQWGLTGLCSTAHSNPISYAVQAHVFIVKIDSQVYPGPNFPPPDRKLIDELQKVVDEQEPTPETIKKIAQALKDTKKTKLGM